jgi:hypothetical protein
MGVEEEGVEVRGWNKEILQRYTTAIGGKRVGKKMVRMNIIHCHIIVWM